MEKEKSKIKYCILKDKRVPGYMRKDGLFYYELRENGTQLYIEKRVIVDFGGTLVTNTEVLQKKEYLNLNTLRKKCLLKKEMALNPFYINTNILKSQNMGKYRILDKAGNYTLIERLNKNVVEKYVIAFNLNMQKGSWGSGEYFADLFSAVGIFNEKYKCQQRKEVA